MGDVYASPYFTKKGMLFYMELLNKKIISPNVNVNYKTLVSHYINNKLEEPKFQENLLYHYNQNDSETSILNKNNIEKLIECKKNLIKYFYDLHDIYTESIKKTLAIHEMCFINDESPKYLFTNVNIDYDKFSGIENRIDKIIAHEADLPLEYESLYKVTNNIEKCCEPMSIRSIKESIFNCIDASFSCLINKAHLITVDENTFLIKLGNDEIDIETAFNYLNILYRIRIYVTHVVNQYIIARLYQIYSICEANSLLLYKNSALHESYYDGYINGGTVDAHNLINGNYTSTLQLNGPDQMTGFGEDVDELNKSDLYKMISQIDEDLNYKKPEYQTITIIKKPEECLQTSLQEAAKKLSTFDKVIIKFIQLFDKFKEITKRLLNENKWILDKASKIQTVEVDLTGRTLIDYTKSWNLIKLVNVPEPGNGWENSLPQGFMNGQSVNKDALNGEKEPIKINKTNQTQWFKSCLDICRGREEVQRKLQEFSTRLDNYRSNANVGDNVKKEIKSTQSSLKTGKVKQESAMLLDKVFSDPDLVYIIDECSADEIYHCLNILNEADDGGGSTTTQTSSAGSENNPVGNSEKVTTTTEAEKDEHNEQTGDQNADEGYVKGLINISTSIMTAYDKMYDDCIKFISACIK